MKRTVVSLLVIAFLISVLLAVPASGNASFVPAGRSPGAAVSPPQAEGEPTAADIASRAIEANLKVTSFKYNMDMTMGFEMTGGAAPGNMGAIVNATGVMDMVKKDMQMTMNMSMEGLPGMPKFDTRTEYYLVGEFMYIKVDIPGMGAQWVKMKLDEEQRRLRQAQVSPGAEWLQTAAEITLLGTENVDGVLCYVVQIKPDMQALFKWAMQQQGGTMKDLDASGLDIAQVFKRMLVKEWVAKDNYLFVKTDIDLLMEFPGSPGKEAEKFAMVINASVKSYDHNQPVSIVVPPEALNAPEMPAP